MTSTEAPVNSTDDNGLIATLEEQVLQLIDHEGWLDAQIRELEFANENDTASIHDDERSAEDVRKDLEMRIDYLKQELALAVSMDTIRTKVFDSAHGYQVVLKSFFKGEQDLDEK
ncbi:hypothetical protein BGZ51_008702 [Haplosporangium sp. Z 767]|nr:hypothetical protein BGZ51_008702 [Haplosporangium sp. Z 767]